MKLEPVYLVAPKPQPPTMPTRRAFLLAGCTFAVGSMAGGACGYSMGVAKGEGEAAPVASPTEWDTVPQTSGDAQLDYLRKFAREATIDQLMDKAPQFLAAQAIDYPKDRFLWVGVDRISAEIIGNPQRSIDHVQIQVVIQHIQSLSPPAELRLANRIPQLQTRKDQEKRRR